MIKTILSHVKEYKKASLLTPMFVICEVFLDMSLPFLMSFIIDQGISKGNIKNVLLYGLLMIVIALISTWFGVLSGFNGAKASAGLAKNLRQAMFEKIQSFSFQNIDHYETSSLITRMMSDTTNVQNSYLMMLRMLVRSPITLVVAMFMTYSINGKLANIFLVALIFLVFALGGIIAIASPLFKKVFQRYDVLNAGVQENISNIRVVKAFVKEEEEKKKFKIDTNVLAKMFIKVENIIVLNMPLMNLTMYACIIALSWFGGKMIVVNELTTGQLMSMFAYTMNILMSLMMMAMVFVMVSMSLASAKRIADLLNDEPTITNPENAITTIKDGSIDYKNVSFGYHTGYDKEVLRNINLSIKSGETIGILGGTGSSKSTLVQLLGRFYDVNSGEVLVGGVNVKEYDLNTLRQQVAMVLQKNELFSGTIIENLRWGKEDATMEEMEKACQDAQASEFIDQFPDGYNTYIEAGGVNLSGGQKQRLCIARALVSQPKILILDDSTSAVDTSTDRLIREAFKNNYSDITKIIIGQRISSIEEADRIVVLDNGKIVDIGTNDELLTRCTIYQEVAQSQRNEVSNND